MRCISIALARRGADDAWRGALRLALQRAPRLDPAAAALLLARCLEAAPGTYYNTHVLNEYLTAKDRRDIQANYERSFKTV